jgi:hypothetical protein
MQRGESDRRHGRKKEVPSHQPDWKVLDGEGCLGRVWNPPIDLGLPLLALPSKYIHD